MATEKIRTARWNFPRTENHTLSQAISEPFDKHIVHVGSPASTVPVCVDLDGTLLRGNTLLETALAVLRERPWMFLAFPFWYLRGQAYLWMRLAEKFHLEVELLPFRPEVLSWLRLQRAQGRLLYLVTGAHRAVAELVAAHLDLFDGVLATDGNVHNVGISKRDLLTDRFSAYGFDYVADSIEDLPVWMACRQPVVLSHCTRAIRSLSREGRDYTAIGCSEGSVRRALVGVLRPHQWAKNALLFAAPLLSHKIFSVTVAISAVLAMLCFCGASSAVYVFNDLMDLEADRRHFIKRGRPFASGDLTLLWAPVLLPTLLIATVSIGFFSPHRFLAWLAVYFVVSLAYSLLLKATPVLDVITLAFLYAIRVWAGGAATGIEISPWTIAFIMFFFFSLALAKRYSELHNLFVREQRQPGRRGYVTTDMQGVQSLGTSSALVAILVLALYINAPENLTLYRYPGILWSLCPLLGYWISRLWLTANRGDLNEDPILHSLHDRTSYIVGALALLIIFLAAVL